jgi:hypothetical protein
MQPRVCRLSPTRCTCSEHHMRRSVPPCFTQFPTRGTVPETLAVLQPCLARVSWCTWLLNVGTPRNLDQKDWKSQNKREVKPGLDQDLFESVRAMGDRKGKWKRSAPPWSNILSRWYSLYTNSKAKYWPFEILKSQISHLQKNIKWPIHRVFILCNLFLGHISIVHRIKVASILSLLSLVIQLFNTNSNGKRNNLGTEIKNKFDPI